MSLQKLFNSTQPGSKYLPVLRKNKSATPNEQACNYRPPHRAQAQWLPAPAAIFWSLHGRSDRTFSPNVPQEAKTRGSCLVFLPRLGERTRVRSGAAGSEGLTLLERLQWHRCPLPTPKKITYVDRDALRMEPS